VTARRAAQIGDIFSVSTSRADALFGRVVSTSAVVGPRHGCNLVYVYRPGSPLSRDDLLVPPMMTTHAPWSRGYFQFVRSEPLLPGDFFEHHSFRDAQGSLYDEESRPLQAPLNPVGRWQLYEEVAAIEALIDGALRPSSSRS
jgi:hypothetical protein